MVYIQTDGPAGIFQWIDQWTTCCRWTGRCYFFCRKSAALSEGSSRLSHAHHVICGNYIAGYLYFFFQYAPQRIEVPQDEVGRFVLILLPCALIFYYG